MNKLLLFGIGIIGGLVGYSLMAKKKDPRENFITDLKQKVKLEDQYSFMNGLSTNEVP